MVAVVVEDLVAFQDAVEAAGGEEEVGESGLQGLVKVHTEALPRSNRGRF